jgi:photosystem II stability/assembly factor-like uncharacterized protein
MENLLYMKKILAHAALLVLFIHPIIFSQSGWFWQNPLPQGNTLNCISILPSKKIVLGGDYGTILISTNLGENWKYIKSCGLINSSCYEDFEALYFVNENTGYAATEGGKIICTTN